jgi:rhamnosyltransferase
MADTSGGAKRPLTVLMRCYNEMPFTKGTVERLFKQRFQDFDVLVVDSGSTDGSFEIFKEWQEKEKGKRSFEIIRIDKKDYFSGRTLNMAMGKTNSDIVVLLNADATPADEFWLERLVKPFEDAKVAATFSRQIARPETKPPLCYDTDRFYPPEKPNWDWKFVIHFSNVCTALRRSLWVERPFYTERYASEDKEWAMYWMDRGFKIEYVPEAVVLHSHNYTLKQYRYRMYIEAVADMYIYPEMKPSIPRLVKYWGGAVLRDWKRSLVKGHVLALFRSPLLRFAQILGTYDGQKEEQANRSKVRGERSKQA